MVVPTHRRSRVLAVMLLVALVTSVGIVLGTGDSQAAARVPYEIEREFVSQVNRERAAAGLDRLLIAPDLAKVARTQAGVMARSARLFHSPDLGARIRDWQRAGENVGRGASVDAVHDAFMASPSHASNVLDPDWGEIGIGVEVRDGQIWVTEVFRERGR